MKTTRVVLILYLVILAFGLFSGCATMGKVEDKGKVEVEDKAKVEAQAETKAEVKAEVKTETEAEAKGKVEAEAKGKVEDKAKVEAQAETKAEVKAEVKTETEAEAKGKVEAEAKAKAKAKAKVEAKVEAEAEVKAETTAETRPAAKVEVLSLPGYERPAPEKQLPREEPLDIKSLVLEDKPVMINVDGMPLSDFIVYAIGNTLKVTFFMDEAAKNIKTPVTLRMTQEMPASRALEIALDVLKHHNLIVEQRSGALYILQAKPAPRQPLDIRVGRQAAESPANIMQIVHIRHLNVAELAGLMSEVYKTNVATKVYYKENALMLTGPASSIKDLLDFIELMDVPYLTGKKPLLTQLTYWQPEEFVRQMTTILQGLGFTISSGPSFPGILFIPIKYLNSILIVSPDDNTMKVVMDWKNRLDTAESAGTEEKSFIFRPKYSRASELVDSLKKLYGILPSPSPSQQKGVQPVAAPAPAPQVPLTFTGFKMSSDDRKNMIIMMAAPSVYKSILPILNELDVPPKQVLIEATVAELQLSGDLEFGLEWYVKNRMQDGNYTLSTLGNLGLNSQPAALAFSFLSDTQRFQAAIKAFASESKVNIIASPRLMVLDNEDATIQIGSDEPYNTGDTQTTTGGSLISISSVAYRNTGLMLKVKPTINAEGILTLNLAIEQSSSEPTKSSTINSPTFLTKRINTIVAAATGQSVLLGGLMYNTTTDSATKVPLLGDIPLLGNLFKTNSKISSKRELIILVTPTIIKSTEDAALVTNEFRQGLKWLR